MIEAEDFFQVGGTLSDDAPSYIERPADNKLLAALERGEICLVLAPRQTGKSSLMVHALERLKKKNFSACTVDCQPLGSVEDPDKWFGDVVYQIERSLGLDTDTTQWWEDNKRLGPTQRFMSFLEDVVLAEKSGKVVLFFDEIDSLLKLPFSDDFFTTIRSIYNARAINSTLKRLIFVLLGMATPSSFSKDPTRTPFNIGKSITLDDFDQESTEPFYKVLGADSKPLVNRIFYWTSGQPLLVQTLAAISGAWMPGERTAEKIDEEVDELYFQDKNEQDVHIKFISDYLLGDTANLRQALGTYRKVLQGKDVKEDKHSQVQNHLKIAGIVRGKDKKLLLRNLIYSRIFNLEWVREKTPPDIKKWVAYSASFALLILLLRINVLQPAFFPKFPPITKIVKYTSEPSVEVQISLAGTNVSRVSLDKREILNEEKVLISQDKIIRETLGGLPVGRSAHSLELSAGLFETTYEIPVEVVYYPQWEIRQFPDARLEQFNPILEIAGPGIKIKDLNNGKILGSLKKIQSKKQNNIKSVSLSSDRKFVLSGSEKGVLTLWDINTRRERKTFTGHKEAILCTAFSPDGKTAISGGIDNTIKLWDLKSGKELATFTGHKGKVNSVKFSPNGKSIVSGSEDYTIKRWDIITHGELGSFTGHKDSVLDVAFSRDGKRIISGSKDRTIKLWDVKTGQELKTFTNHNGVVRKIAFSADGKFILSGSDDRTLKLLEIKTGIEKQTFNAGNDKVKEITFSPDGQLVSWQSITGEVKVWEVKTVKSLQTFSGHKDSTIGVAFSPDGGKIVSASLDGTLKLWDVESGQVLRTLSGHQDQVIGVDFSPDGKMIVSGSSDETLKLWDVESGQVLRTFSGHKKLVGLVAFSTDGKTVISGSNDKTLKLWDVKNGKEIRTFSGHVGRVNGVAFSPDGKTVISGSDDDTLKLWDVKSGKEIRTFSGNEAEVGLVAFSPDGKTVISGSEDGTMKLWDIENGKIIRTFSGHKDRVLGVAFSPNGRTVISASRDKTLKLWDVESGKEMRTFTGHKGKVALVAFSPDGKTVISTSEDGTLKLWWAAVEPK